MERNLSPVHQEDKGLDQETLLFDEGSEVFKGSVGGEGIGRRDCDWSGLGGLRICAEQY